jgi:hypothetical protein
MIRSAAIVKTRTLAPWKELRLQKRKLKKTQAAERKATKRVHPSPIGRRVPKVEPPVIVADESPATRDEMLQRAEAIGLKVDKRWSDSTMLKRIEGHVWVTPSDNL